MYMSSGAYASNAPEALLLRAVQGHMADFYSVPAWYGAGATTAKEPGVQSAYENTLAMITAYARRRLHLRHRPARRLAHPLPREHGRRRRDASAW